MTKLQLYGPENVVNYPRISLGFLINMNIQMFSDKTYHFKDEISDFERISMSSFY